MKTGTIDFQKLRNFAISINGSTMKTIMQQRVFYFTIDDLGFHYVPQSTLKPRVQEFRYIERVLERFNITKSLRPGDYIDITMNASYLITVIASYLNSEEK